MPTWHTKSTISGDLTSVGIAAAAHAASLQHSPIHASGTGSNAAILESLSNPGARPMPKAGPSSNAAILSGLGKAPNGSPAGVPGVKVEEGTKAVIDNQSDCTSCYFGAYHNLSTDKHSQIMMHTMLRYIPLHKIRRRWTRGAASSVRNLMIANLT